MVFLPSANIWLRQSESDKCWQTYLHCRGIESLWYFAPNVPGNYKLVFELYYSDGRVEYVLPSVSSAAAALRMKSVCWNNIGRTHMTPSENFWLKTLAQSIWREHPEVETIPCVFAQSVCPA